MTFIPAHDAIVMFRPEPGEIKESTNGTAPAEFNDEGSKEGVLPILKTPANLLGYTDFPEFARGLNNSKGFAIGKQGAAYNKRGRREPSITVNLRPGNVGVLDYLFPSKTTGRLPSLALFVITKGVSCDHFRFCKPSSVAFTFSGGEGQGGELTIAVTFQATAHIHEPYTNPLTSWFPDAELLRTLGEPLMWHDVRGLSIKPSGTGAALALRQAVSSLSVTLDMGLERKNERPFWGDDVALSSTSYDMLEHHKTVTGEMTLHERLPRSFFDSAHYSQNWGDLDIECSNVVVAGLNPLKKFSLRLSGCLPTDEKSAGGESSKEIDYNVSFAADDIELNPVVSTGSGSGSGSGSGGA